MFALAKSIHQNAYYSQKVVEKNRADLRSNPRLYFLIANVDKNLGEIVIEEV
jgi:hypothetical protein